MFKEFGAGVIVSAEGRAQRAAEIRKQNEQAASGPKQGWKRGAARPIPVQ